MGSVLQHREILVDELPRPVPVELSELVTRNLELFLKNANGPVAVVDSEIGEVNLSTFNMDHVTFRTINEKNIAGYVTLIVPATYFNSHGYLLDRVPYPVDLIGSLPIGATIIGVSLDRYLCDFQETLNDLLVDVLITESRIIFPQFRK